jgi:hypothetical protein
MDTVFRYNVLFHERIVHGIFQRFVGFIVGLFRDVEINKATAFGFTIWKISNSVYDLLIFTVVLARFGWVGVPFLAVGAGVLCWFTILIYDSTKIDFLGIESAKKEMLLFKEKMTAWVESLEGKPGQKLRLPLLKIKIKYDTDSIKIALSKIWVVEFLICTFQWDATVTTIYLREKSFGGLTRRDWKIFLTSVVLSCVYWSAIVLAGITVFEWSQEVMIVILLIIWNR